MTDECKTDPTGLRPSLYPDEEAVLAHAAATAEAASEQTAMVAAYLRGQIRGNAVDVAQSLAKHEAEFEARIEGKVDALTLAINELKTILQPFGDRLTAIEGNCIAHQGVKPFYTVPPESEAL